MNQTRTVTPTCVKYALYVSEKGRKVTQPWPFVEEPPMYYDTLDGERLPLVMVGTYDPKDDRSHHIGTVKAKARQEWAEVERRRREFAARRAS